MIDMDIVDRAILVATEAHKGQMYDIFPYCYHLEQVVRVAKDLGYDRDIIVSCYLHDTIEDTTISYNDIKKEFGEEIAEIVYAVTDELGRNRKERKEKTYPKIRANWKATVVKLCDRIANMEQSMKYKPEKLKMYWDENNEFNKSLHTQDNLEHTMKAWKRYTSLLSECMDMI